MSNYEQEPFTKVIIWGHPLNTHTHSYIHYGWFKAFRYMGYEVYWYDDKHFPIDLNFKQTLFITEGSVDKNIPLHESNIYCVHNTNCPRKYINCGARLIDLRLNILSLNDSNYVFKLSDKQLQKISEVVLYEKNSSDRDLNPRLRHHSPLIYEAVYLIWATDLLPNEINLEDRFIEPTKPNYSYFIGKIHPGNKKEIDLFTKTCSQKGIRFIHNDPQVNPLSCEEFKDKIQTSYVTVDIRGSGDPSKLKLGENGTNHKDIGFVSCRIFKNISYGKLGITNSMRVKELFGDNIIIEENESKLIDTYLEKSKDKDFIKHQMLWVQENHTYINRINDLLTIINRKL